VTRTLVLSDIPHVAFWLLRHSATKYGKVLPFALPLRRRPHVVELELTNDCDIDCGFCYRTRMTRPVGYMARETLLRIADEIAGWRYCVVRLVGVGEPALHPDFADLLGILRDRCIPVEVTTNGRLFQRFTPEQILDLRIHTIGVSVDGYDAASYNKLRRGGDHDRLLADVTAFATVRRRLGHAHPWIVIRNVLLPAAEFRDPARIAAFKRRWSTVSDRIRFNTLEKPRDEIHDTGRVCDDIFYTMHVRWDGRVPLCGYHQLYAAQEWMGEVGQASLESIWHAARWDEVRHNHISGDLATSPFCRRCFTQQCQKRIKTNQRDHNWNAGGAIAWLERQAWRLVR